MFAGPSWDAVRVFLGYHERSPQGRERKEGQCWDQLLQWKMKFVIPPPEGFSKWFWERTQSAYRILCFLKLLEELQLKSGC